MGACGSRADSKKNNQKSVSPAKITPDPINEQLNGEEYYVMYANGGDIKKYVPRLSAPYNDQNSSLFHRRSKNFELKGSEESPRKPSMQNVIDNSTPAIWFINKWNILNIRRRSKGYFFNVD